MRFNPLPDFRNSTAELLYVGERKFSVTEIRFPGRHSPREPSRAKPQTEPQAGSNGFAFSKQKMRKAGWRIYETMPPNTAPPAPTAGTTLPIQLIKLKNALLAGHQSALEPRGLVEAPCRVSGRRRTARPRARGTWR